MTPEASITGGTPDVSSTTPESGVSTAGSSPASQGTSAPPEQSASTVPADVQGKDSQTDDVGKLLASLPSVDELKVQAEQGIQHAAALANLRGVIDPLRTQLDDISGKYKVFETAADRFQSPEDFQKIIELQDSLIGWTNDPQSGQPIPNTERGAQLLVERYPQHANDLVATLAEMPAFDSVTGRTMPRWEIMLHGMAENPQEKARAAQILGLVEPNSIAPQWQPSAEDLAAICVDPNNPSPQEKSLQDVFRKMPFEDREELKLNSPEYIRKTLAREKLTQDLEAQSARTEQERTEQSQKQEQYFNQQAQQAGDKYVQDQLKQALTTFHESVVQQCNFIEPIDPQNPPQGLSPQEVTQMNQQIVSANKAEAAQITGLVVSLFNPQTKEYVLPLLKEIGAIDDKMLADLDKAAGNFGNNGRNFANLSFRQQLQANGNGYQPGPDVTQLSNEAQRGLKLMAHYANQIKGKLLEKRSEFFTLKATGHNSTLDSSRAVRPAANGRAFDPTTATVPQPSGFMSRQEIEKLYG